MTAVASHQEHRTFLNRYYGISRHFYDVTRKYYLFGRDRECRELLNESWQSLIEIGPGTGRNLKVLHRSRPSARYGGVEASDEMLLHAQRSCPFATIQHGFAEDAHLSSVLGTPPDRILFSYCLSMVQNPRLALKNAVESLAPNGEVVIVDFGDCAKGASAASRMLGQWLRWFHVEPLDTRMLMECGARVQHGPGNYYVRARIVVGGQRPTGF